MALFRMVRIPIFFMENSYIFEPAQSEPWYLNQTYFSSDTSGLPPLVMFDRMSPLEESTLLENVYPCMSCRTLLFRLIVPSYRRR